MRKTHTKEYIFKKSKELIKKHNLVFVEDVVAMLEISKPTFYDRIKVGTDEFNKLSELMGKNKIDLKVSMRKKWHDSDNATLQMGLYKLLSTDVEHKKLNKDYKEVEIQSEQPLFPKE